METSGTIKVEQRAVADLIPFARNSRTHSDEQVAQIAASIREFGWTNPVLIDGSNGIIAGHGRLAAARKLGMAEIPVIVLDHLTDAQKRALVIADNKLALNAGWDAELLSSEIAGLGEDGFDLSLLGFSEDELSGLLAEKTEGLTDPDEAPNPPEIPVSCPGDVWLLGKHRLMCGDSTSVDDMGKLTAGHLWASDRKQTTILEFDKPSRNGEHPTMKPVALFEYQMLNNTKGGDIVLDSFGGSGTTLIAAEKNGRIARLMELDPRYCDVIIKRWQEFTGQEARHEATGRTFAEMAANPREPVEEAA